MASNASSFGGTPVPTSTSHTGNNTAGPFAIDVAYGTEGDIQVFVAGVLKTRTTHYTFTSPTQITFTSGNEPANGATILFQRNTFVGASNHLFSDASVLSATELNENNKQVLHGIQELVDDYVRRDGTQTIRANLVFEGPVDDDNETTLAIENPTADRTITLPDTTGTIVTTGDTGTVTSTMINDGTIVNADISGTAGISGSKLQPASTSNPGSMSSSDKSKLDGIESGATADQTAAEIRTLVESASDSNVFTDADHSKLNNIEAGATGDQSNAEIRAAVEAASDSNVFTDADHSKLNGIEAGATGDQTNAEIRTAVEAANDSNVFTDADHTKLNNAATLTDSQTLTNKTLTSPVINDVSGTAIVTSGTSTSDTKVYSAKRVGELFYGKDTLEEIQSGETWSAADTKIATTAAIDARIIDFVDDVGGFNAIANETSFPSTNPQGSAGQVAILSIATVSTNLTPSSNTITIANGAGTGNTVTINNVTPSSVPQGFGLIVESTSTLHTYNFHRLVPKATEVSTVASISGNVTTVAGISSNVTTVANNDSNVTAVAGKATEIGRLGTTDAVADMALLGTADAVSDMNTLGTSSNVTNMNTLAGISSNITTVAGVSSDVSTVAGISSNVTSVANNSSNINSAVSNASNINAAVSNASNINSAVSNASNITTVAGSISNVNTTAGSIANVNSVASNIANVDNFAEKYQIAANNPSTDGGGNALAAGDLYFNTSANELKVYNGSAWQGGVTATGSFAVVTGNTFTGDNKYNDGVKLLVGTGSDLEIFHHATDGSFINDAGTSTLKLQLGGSTKLEIQSGGIGVTGDIAVSGNVDGRDVATDGAKLDGIAASSTANPNAIDNVVEDTSPQLGGDLDVQTSKVTTSTSNGNVKIEPNGTGVVEVRGAGGNDGKLQLNCSAQSHGIKLASPAHSAGQSYTFIFPDNQIAADKYLKVKSITGSGATATGQLEYASLDANDLGEGTIPSGRFGTDTIATGSLAAGALPADVTVASANIVDGTIVNADINASAAIALSKLATGALPSAITVASANLVDGTIVNADINASAGIAGTKVTPSFGSQNLSTSGTAATGALTVTGNVTVTGTVDGVDIATRDTLFGGLTSSSGVLTNGVTATTQSASDNSTKVATTAYTDTAIANLVDSSPSALNTLNELAAAINDDASFSTTMTNALAGKLATNGNGSSLTNLNASNISSGTIAAARVGDISGNAASADTVDIGTANASQNYYPVFTETSGSAKTINIDGGNNLTYNPGTNTLTAGTFSGSGSGLTSVDANTLDGIDSSSFLRSDAADTATGTLTVRDIKFSAGYHLQRSDHHSGHLEGSYNNVGANSYKSNPIYTIGSAYNPNDADLNNMYGIGYTHTNASFISFTGASGWGMYVAADGDARIFLGGGNGVISSTGQHYVGSNVVWNAGNDGVGSGLDADLLRGYGLTTGSTANTVVLRDANADINARYFDGTRYYFPSNHYLSDKSGDYGSIQVNAASGSGWEGFSIDGRAVFMHDGSNSTGLYNDVNNEWLIQCVHNGSSYVYYNGGAKISTTSAGCNITGSLTATGNVTAYSDARLKTNVNTIDNALDIVDQLRGVSFDWKESGEHSIGVIAQEVEEVLPELVLDATSTDPETKEETTVKTVDYGKMVGVLINAIKELKAEVKELKGGK